METTLLLQGNVYSADCATRQILDRIGDKWTTLVILLLEARPKRFSELRNSMEGISQKMLTQTLRSLERDGLVTRTVYPEVPPRVEYELTSLGKTLCPLLSSIACWAQSHIGEVTEAQVCYDAREGSARG